jgi:hypothetical protein
MAFTPDDVAAVERAIIALATGARTTQVHFADGRRVIYTETQIETLRELLGFIEGKVAPAIGADPTLTPGGIMLAGWNRSP